MYSSNEYGRSMRLVGGFYHARCKFIRIARKQSVLVCSFV